MYIDWAVKHHRDRGGHRREEESLLDKQERERDKKDRNKDDDKKGKINKYEIKSFKFFVFFLLIESNRNLTCYKCEGDLCRDPFQSGHAIPTVECEHSCWVNFKK